MPKKFDLFSGFDVGMPIESGKKTKSTTNINQDDFMGRTFQDNDFLKLVNESGGVQFGARGNEMNFGGAAPRGRGKETKKQSRMRSINSKDSDIGFGLESLGIAATETTRNIGKIRKAGKKRKEKKLKKIKAEAIEKHATKLRFKPESSPDNPPTISKKKSIRERLSSAKIRFRKQEYMK